MLAPPKFDLPPNIVKEQLIPKYQGVSNMEENLEMNDELHEELEEESSSEDDDEQEAAAKFRERYLIEGPSE